MASQLRNLLIEVAKIEEFQNNQVRIKKPQPSITKKFVVSAAVLTGILLTGRVGVLVGTVGLVYWAVCSSDTVLKSVSQIIVNHLTPEQQKDLVAPICGNLNTVHIPSTSDFEITVARNPSRIKVVTRTVISFIQDQPHMEFVNPQRGRRIRY